MLTALDNSLLYLAPCTRRSQIASQYTMIILHYPEARAHSRHHSRVTDYHTLRFTNAYFVLPVFRKLHRLTQIFVDLWSNLRFVEGTYVYSRISFLKYSEVTQGQDPRAPLSKNK